ncbi:gamete egress and sporozoite traversal protein, putative [Plasmodium relictum]|uniref:Gamete egress and sporozoite traversal protein, putative n=1 Tax=Plasmodium relictum TaxID=85471 RepID=A0A1J1H930_PLARL|nr:gamete egress and sporozoite traversal protein, putative [Plasmodium relictum]CRH01436.1 gamete egress and sporozoite traversal protein, putative [Plasmodium relictum]
MKTFMYYFGLLLTLALHLRAIQLHSMSYMPSTYIEIGDKISSRVGELWDNQFESFLDLVSKKIVDKLGNNISNDKISNNMMILLQNDAEIFDPHHYKDHNIALIQTIFFRKLKEKFNNSKFGKKVKELGARAKKKIVDLYHKHKGKLQHFFKILMRSLVLPIAIQYIRRNIKKWREKTLEATEKLDPDSKKIATPIIDRLYTTFGNKVDQYAEENSINFEDEMQALDELAKDKKEIDILEKEEKAILKD